MKWLKIWDKYIKTSRGEIMSFNKDSRYKIINSYQLSPQQLEEIHKIYGRPGEMSPGQPAKTKRNRLDKTLAAMDRRNKDVIPVDDESETQSDIINFSTLQETEKDDV